MSLVNQMLQDLEQRRTAEAGVSPLGGLSASGATVSVAHSINYLLLGITLILAFAVVFAVIYVVDLKQPAETLQLNKMESKPIVPAVVTSVAPAAILPEEKKIVVPVVVSQVIPVAKVKETPVNEATISASAAERSEPPEVAVMPDADSDGGTMVGTIVGTMSIVESRPITDDAKPSAATEDEQKVNKASETVNKTIRPLTSEQQAQLTFQRAVKLLGRGEEVAAQQALEKTLAFEPVHVRARETLAALLLNTGRVSEAASSLRDGLRLQPTAATLAKLYARILVDQGDNHIAVAVLERAHPPIRIQPDYYALLAVLYRGVGKHAQAAMVYEQILKVRPGVATWWMGLGLSKDAIGESSQALTAYQRASRSGGLNKEVLDYVRSRITALSASVKAKPQKLAPEDHDGFEG